MKMPHLSRLRPLTPLVSLAVLLPLAGATSPATRPVTPPGVPSATRPADLPVVKVEVDYTLVPDLADKAPALEKAVERFYPWVFDRLDDGDLEPLTEIRVVLDPEYDGIARAGGQTVIFSADWFREHPDDWPTLVHELVHLVQQYPAGSCPTWLSEGIADHVRFFQFEPENRPHPGPTAKHTDSYRTTAAFLDWVQVTYDPDLVATLNTAIRKEQYREDLWPALTGHSLADLGAAWQKTLR